MSFGSTNSAELSIVVIVSPDNAPKHDLFVQRFAPTFNPWDRVNHLRHCQLFERIILSASYLRLYLVHIFL